MMQIVLKPVTVGEVCEGYLNDDEEGVVGYGGMLDIRPRYQRLFIYNPKQQAEVIRTILKGLPLNVMYWNKTNNGTFEVLDGQQRTLSFCEYVDGSFSVDGYYFDNLPEDKRRSILDYELLVYVCEGTESDRLNWFQIINIAGEELTAQELRNAVYAGPWTADAKRYFCKSGCPAYQIANRYLTGSSIRQEYLETALKWITQRDGMTIEEYMGQHQQDSSAVPLWNYFHSVISWVDAMFTKYRPAMKGIPWGPLYDANHERDDLDPVVLEEEVSRLMEDPDVTNSKGIYQYVLDGDERHLNIRAFDTRMKESAYERQAGICVSCGKHFDIKSMQADHITPWSKGGQTIAENCQLLCADCNRRKSNI